MFYTYTLLLVPHVAQHVYQKYGMLLLNMLRRYVLSYSGGKAVTAGRASAAGGGCR